MVFDAEFLKLSCEPLSPAAGDWPQVNHQHAGGLLGGMANVNLLARVPISARREGCRCMALSAMHRSSNEWRCERHLVTRKLRAEADEWVASPSVVCLDVAGLYGRPHSSASRIVRLQPTVPA